MDAPFPSYIAGRVIGNAFTDRWHENYQELLDNKEDIKTDIALATQNADLNIAPVSAGSGSGAIKSIETVSDIMQSLVIDTESILADLKDQLLTKSP